MLSTDMMNEFLLLYDIRGNAAIGFEDSEVYEFLSKAQIDVAKEVFAKYGSAAVSTLISRVDIPISGGADCRYNVADQYSPLYYGTLMIVSAKINAIRTFAPVITTPELVPVDILPPELENKFLCTSYNKTVFIRPKLFIGSDLDELQDADTVMITDPYTVIDTIHDKLQVVRVVIPGNIDDQHQPQLDERWHADIVDKAVELSIIVTGDRRTNTEIQLNK